MGWSQAFGSAASRRRRGGSLPRYLGATQLLQPLAGGVQRGIFLAEGKTHLLRPVPGFVVETRSRNRGNPDVFHQIFHKLKIIREPECADVSHNVISSAREKAAETSFVEHRKQPVTPLAVPSAIPGNRLQAPQRGRARLLQRGGAPTVRKSCTLRMASVIPGGATAHPTRQPVTLYVFDIPLTMIVRSRIPSSVGHRDVLGAVVENVLVDLVGDRQNVEFHWQSAAISSSSSLVNTLPVGLFGVLMMMALVVS